MKIIHLRHLGAGLQLALLPIWLLGVTAAFAQTTDAVLSGAVRDPSGAVIPGAAVTVQNLKTGQVTKTLCSDAGIYWFAALQPGLYRLSAESAGFRKLVYNDLPLEVGSRLNLNLPLQRGDVTESVEKPADEVTLLAGASSSVGFVIAGEELASLPLPDRNALGLVFIQPGVVGNNFNGARRGALNITLDGINVQSTAVNTGISSALFSSVDRIAAFRVVTSPADAEYGRGSGQIQMVSRSGANEFHGSLFESHRNTVLNANDWFNNQLGVGPVTGEPVSPRNILIRNQYGGRLGGRLIRNKTFFHVLFDAQRERTRDALTNITYTETARRGLFRFFPGARNGNANAAVPTVDLSGNPLRPAQATGPLQTVNVLGRDPNRLVPDRSGVVGRLLELTPLPNNFRSGDGLNTAGYTWSRSASVDFDHFHIRLDHAIAAAHRLAFAYTRQEDSRENGFLPQSFPTAPGGASDGGTRLYSLSVTSAWRPNLLNEFRAGAMRFRIRNYAPWEGAGTALQPMAGNEPYLLNLGGITNPLNIAGDSLGRTLPLYQYGDTVTWLKDRHAFKFGGEVRFTSANMFSLLNVAPRVSIGTVGVPVQNINTIPGIGQNLFDATTLLVNLAGSVQQVIQAFNSPGGANPAFLVGEANQRTWRQREFSFFFKDDFKVTPNLTLNLGIRYEWYGAPFEANGKAVAPLGGAAGLFGISGSGFADLFQPGRSAGSLTRLQTVGLRSQNPDVPLYRNDRNNFAPAVGLAWGVPWWGAGKTVARLGYGIGYERNALLVADGVAGQIGLQDTRNFSPSTYLDLSGVRLPLTPLGRPLEAAPPGEPPTPLRAFDDRLRSPYIQNWNAGIQRELARNTLLEVRYVGGKGTRLIRSAEINEVNIFESGILDAYRITQAGGNSPLLDRMFRGLNIGGLGMVDGVRITGSDAARFISNTQMALANHNVGGFGGFLNSTNQFTGQFNGLRRRAGLPENWLVANPEYAQARLTSNFANSTYHALQVEVMRRFSAGWTLGGNYTWSRALGEEEGDGQDLFDNFRTLRNRRLDKRLLAFHRTHAINSYGTWELPFGPGKSFAASSRGFVARLVEGWQVAAFLAISSGPALGLSSGLNSFNTSGAADNPPVAVAPFAKSAGGVQRTGNGVVYFGDLRQVPDPSIAGLTTAQGIRDRSPLLAIADASGRLRLVNPTPGEMGNLAPRFIEGPGLFHLDLSLAKRVVITERMNLELRADAIGFTNSPNFGPPVADINNTNFGRINGATGERIVVVGIRFSF